MPKTTPSAELIVPGIIPEAYRPTVHQVYNTVKNCTTLAEAKALKYGGKKPGSLSVVSQNNSILFFERPQNVFARITFNNNQQ